MSTAHTNSPMSYGLVVEADSLVYLSVDGLVAAVQGGIDKSQKLNSGHCTACLTGHYPVDLVW